MAVTDLLGIMSLDEKVSADEKVMQLSSPDLLKDIRLVVSHVIFDCFHCANFEYIVRSTGQCFNDMEIKQIVFDG